MTTQRESHRSFMLLMFFLILTVLVLGEMTPAQAFSGSGTAADPYLIASAADLKQLAADVSNDKPYSGAHFKLTADIVLGGSSDPWTPIGN